MEALGNTMFCQVICACGAEIIVDLGIDGQGESPWRTWPATFVGYGDLAMVGGISVIIMP